VPGALFHAGGGIGHPGVCGGTTRGVSPKERPPPRGRALPAAPSHRLGRAREPKTTSRTSHWLILPGDRGGRLKIFRLPPRSMSSRPHGLSYALHIDFRCCSEFGCVSHPSSRLSLIHPSSLVIAPEAVPASWMRLSLGAADGLPSSAGVPPAISTTAGGTAALLLSTARRLDAPIGSPAACFLSSIPGAQWLDLAVPPPRPIFLPHELLYPRP